MSAWLVSERHINVLVKARRLGDERFDRLQEDMTDDDLGRMLWRENMLSLQARYGDKVKQKQLKAYRYTDPGEFTHAAIFKAIACYEYQTCEHDGWQSSEAKRYCRDLQDVVISALPGYEEAQWGIENSGASKTLRGGLPPTKPKFGRQLDLDSEGQ